MSSQQSKSPPRPLPPDRRGGGTAFARAVGAFVPKVTAAVFERFGFHSAEIMTSWDTIVGAEIARLIRPETIKWPRGDRSRDASADDSRSKGGATLIVACDPAFALEVSYRTEDIIDRINRYFGYRAIAQLKILQAPRLAEKQAAQSPRNHLPRPLSSPIAPGDLGAALSSLGHSIGTAGKAR